ncbi:C-terminal domain of CHU protein family protein [Muriicola jejuensis]|uniref:Gliding motility-associated C-terminal domain-containing protein n=1 Tax=Muriicola jejuensis TaxID=504488 RepID=A0A6P0U9M4_9FLAO|nr:gliding motility-associated C-terminal domain-containing protein [Muriicola jejuensis]NER09935.1 gliding motility-associated C-terminal domain-containing protein [Muriicola jejuensis]SMP04636.1 C-terminal domain of CHU protein family protein [Muriicola jejuensis]
MKTKLFFSLRVLLLPVVLLAIGNVQAQVLNAPVAAPKQTPPPGSTPWNRACASASFNDYWVRFTWNPPMVNTDNEFILELSDADGNFGSPVELARDGSKNLVFDFYMQFQVPTDTRGENYRLRVRSTSPAVTSPASAPYPMYYISVNSGLTIRPQGQSDFGDGTAQVCDGNSITLEVYGLANADTYTYNWYRSGTLLAEKSESITVTSSGMYNVEVDYGACSGSGNTLSNLIDVTSGSSLGIAINPPAKTDLCSGEIQNLEANINNPSLTYTWFKNGTVIPSSNNYIYTVDASSPGFEGDYQVEIFGPGACVERSAVVTMTNAGDFTVNRNNAANVVLLPGQNTTLSVSTDASSPTYQWYRNGSPVAGATTSSLVVSDTETGTYFARVTLSGGACASTSKDSQTTEVVTPDSFELIVDYTAPYTACENTSIALEVVTINALDTGGNPTDVTSSVINNFAYQWKRDGVNVGGATGSSLSLTDPSENGAYTLDGTLSSYASSSNSLSVQLLVNETLTISSTGTMSCGPSEPITISTATDLTGETFSWLRNNSDTGVSTPDLTVTEAGTYQLVLMRNGCPLPSNEIVISPLDENLITLDPGDIVVFPEGGSRTVTASGGSSYRWLDSNNNEMSNSSSMTFTQEGSFVLIASVGNCQVIRNISVTYLDTFKVPNVITVNGDGVNDQWIIPNSYSNKSDVNVIIYNEKGEEVLNEFSYQNNWPSSSVSFPRQNMVFFYKIRNGGEVLKQGTITVIR